MTTKPPRQILQPINTIYRFMDSGERVTIWLLHDNTMRIEGRILGYDEFMNIVLDDAVEHHLKGEGRKVPLGRILLKGDTVGLLHPASAAQ